MNKFNFTDNELKILSNFASIHSSMLIEKDKFSVMNIPKSVIAMYPFDTPYDFDSFGLYDTSDFLAIITALKKANIEVKDKYLSITSENDKLTYHTTAKELCQNIPDINMLLNNSNYVLDFSLPTDRLAVINKMISILKAKYIFFETDNKFIRITVGNELEVSGNCYEQYIEDSININKLSEPIRISVADFKVISGEYNVKIAKKDNKGTNKYFSTWNNLNNVVYFIAAEINK